jgi:hypothetical protein
MEVETYSDYQHSMSSDFFHFVSNCGNIPDIQCIKLTLPPGTVEQLINVVSPRISIPHKPWLANMDLMEISPQKVSEHEIKMGLSLVYHGLYRFNNTVLLSVGQTIHTYDVTGNTWTLLFTEECEHEPHAIVQTNLQHEVYVAFGTYIGVYNINKRSQMCMLRKIPMSPNVTIQSFTLMDDTVICADNSGLTILNPDFSVKEKRNFAIDGDTAYVAGSNKMKRIAFVKKTADEERIVMSQNLSGDTHIAYKMERPDLRGIAFDSQDNIYVCDYHEKNGLVQISSDGVKSRTIRTEISDPYSISFHPEGHRFLIFNMCGRCIIYEIPQIGKNE